ncbi:MAG TPA: MoxR family ATPase, partial [Phycisphaerales bacterium]|nr:MoxR family ATPase [Phycisphaerales bacterium]
EQPFFVLATQNPLEQEGTYPLPEAQLDRFFFKLIVGTPTRAEMAQVLSRTTTTHVSEVEPVLDAERLLEHQRLIRQVAIADHVQDYAVRLVLGTHPGGQFTSSMVQRYVKFGASPRAAQAIVMAAKCRALMDGRSAASIADIQSIATPALRHRLILNFEAQAQGVTADAVVENLTSTLPQLQEA